MLVHLHTAAFVAVQTQLQRQLRAKACAQAGVDDVEIVPVATAGQQVDAVLAGLHGFDPVADHADGVVLGQGDGLFACRLVAVHHDGDPVGEGAQEHRVGDSALSASP